MGDDAKDQESTLYVYPLSSNVTEEHLREIFGNFGKVKTVDLRPLEKKGFEAKYGVVNFEKLDDAKYALSHLDEGEIDGLKVNVSFRPPRS